MGRRELGSGRTPQEPDRGAPKLIASQIEPGLRRQLLRGRDIRKDARGCRHRSGPAAAALCRQQMQSDHDDPAHLPSD